MGELYHKGASYAGEHAPIVAPALFDAVQERLTLNRNGARVKRAASGALLIGRIFDDRDRIAALCRSVEKDVLISSAFGEAARPKDRARLV